MLSRKKSLVVVALSLGLVSSAFAQIDNLATVVSTTLASDTNSFGSFVYMPSTDTVYTATFGGGATFRRINNVGGAQTVDVIANEGQIQLFYRDGDPTRGVTTPIVSGMIYNPAAVGSIAAEGSVWLMDGATTRFASPSTTTDPSVTKRLYRYNLGTIPVGGDGRDVFSSVATLSQFQTAAGGTTNTTSNMGTRKSAFSPNGQSIYSVDSTTAFGGIYRVDPLGGGVTRILDISGNATGNSLINTEPGVLRVDNKDRIFFRGNRVSTATTDFNVGGINYVDYDGVTTSAQQTLLAAADLRSFLELPAVVTTDVTDVRTITFGADETLYFYDQQTNRILARDTQGRLYKVATRTERDLFFTGSTTTTPAPTASVLRLQAREVTHPTAGAITQLLYAESTPLNFVAGAYIFKPTDFNRDGVENAADLDLFEPIIKARGVAAALTDARYDLNGNGVVDWKDVKIAQTFQTFANGDTNFSFAVDFDDLLTLAQNYNLGTDRTWINGDFDGDNDVDFDDLLTLAQNYTSGSIADPSGLSSSFQADWNLARSLVPEPTTLGLIVLASLSVARRRK